MPAVRNGDTIILKLRPRLNTTTGQVEERSVQGKARSFEQDGETRWEVATDDPQYPAIGFIPVDADFEVVD